MKQRLWFSLSLVAFVNVSIVLGQQPATHNTITTTKVENLGPNVNSTADELKPVITVDGKTLYLIRDGHSENKAGQEVWTCELQADGKWGPAIRAGQPINTGQRNASVENVSADGNQLLVRGAYEDGEYDGAGLSVIVRSKKGGWKDPKRLEIKNFEKYSSLGGYSGFYLSPDGKHIIMSFSESKNNERSELYVSHLVLKDVWNKPKSIKDFTKFVSKALNNNTWTEPEKIKSLSLYENTDFAPFIASDGVTLYFASDRAGGLGGVDIWMTRRLDDTWQNWSTPVNMGAPINTDSWDAYYTLDARGEDVFMTSSKNSMGSGDIVKIKLIKELRPNPVVLVTGKVYNAKTNEPLGANIEYENLVDGKNMGIAESNPVTGEYKIVLPYGKNYGFMAYADKFVSVSDNVDLTAVAEYKEIKRDLYLVPLTIGTTIRLNNIFFDVGKATLRPESYPELERLAGIMTKNGKMQIELSGHTDNVGSDEANLKLSEDRAKAVVEYLVSLGIAADRIIAKGYGETKPQGTNDTEEGRQLNRRVEFTILKN